MDTVYLVVGSTGEYSDRTTWTVAAYPTEEAAQQHVDLLNVWRKRQYRNYGNDTVYHVQPVGLYRHPDEFQERQDN